MIIGTRTKFMFAFSALTPLRFVIFALQIKFGLRTYSRRFALFSVPYQDLLYALFFLGSAAFVFSLSLIRDNRSPGRPRWLSQ